MEISPVFVGAQFSIKSFGEDTFEALANMFASKDIRLVTTVSVVALSYTNSLTEQNTTNGNDTDILQKAMFVTILVILYIVHCPYSVLAFIQSKSIIIYFGFEIICIKSIAYLIMSENLMS